MDTILGPILMAIVLVGGIALCFLLFVQPLWSVVDVAVCKEHSGGTKAALIVLALLLGPLMTFFYAVVGTRSRALRTSTLIGSGVVLLAFTSLLGMAIAVPMIQQKLPWWPGIAQKNDPPTGPAAGAQARSRTGADLDADANALDPESVPPFTAVHLGRNGSRWSAAVARCNGHGPEAKSTWPVVLPSIYPLTHVAVDPKGPLYYGITTHQIGRILPDTGQFLELESASEPDGAKPSWPSALAFDSNRELLLIAARSQGYSYNPRTGEWQTLPWLKDDGVVALAYDPGSELLHGLQTEVTSGAITAATRLIQFNAQGALIAKVPLSKPIPVGRYPFPLAQLACVDRRLICIVSPSERELDDGARPFGRMYLIEPSSGKCEAVRSRPTSGIAPPATNALQP